MSLRFQPDAKFLVIRFSSIGDIVLCSPVVRVLRAHYPMAQIDFFTKPQFIELLQTNPYLNQVHPLPKRLYDTVQWVRAQGYTAVIDLHNNLRTNILRAAVQRFSTVLDKQNINKYKLVSLKQNIEIPHIVSRYLDTLRALGITEPDDGKGLDFFIPNAASQTAQNLLTNWGIPPPYIAVVLGATYPTKQWIPEYYIDLLNKLKLPAILLGGKHETFIVNQIIPYLRVPYLNAVGETSLLVSAALMERSALVLTPDTGMMHIAAALNKKIVVLWGNTVPGLGFAPYRCIALNAEVELACRPCHKLGKAACPKQHFDCMRKLYPDYVLSLCHTLLKMPTPN